MGFSINVYEDDIKKSLEDYINNFNEQEFTEKCNRFLEEIYQDEKKCNEATEKFIQVKE